MAGEIRFQNHSVVGKFLNIIPHDIGYNLPLQVGQADNLRSHDNLIGIFRTLCNADKFPAGMQDGGYLQQQPLPVAQAVVFPGCVKQGYRRPFHLLGMCGVAFIPLGHIAG